MFRRLGLQTFYGQAFMCDLAELSGDMLPYSKKRFGELLAPVFEKCPLLKEDFANQIAVTRKYNIFPSAEEWRGKILFAETSEVTPPPEMLREYLGALKAESVFDNVNGIIIGKPMNEKYYEEYKSVWREVVNNDSLPMLYNVNFGHAAPKAILPYGAMAHVDANRHEITLL